MEFNIHHINREIVIEGFNSIYYFEMGKDFSHTPEKHDFWEMVYVDSGEVISITDGTAQTLSQGQVIFHSPNEVHAHVSNRVISNSMLVVSFTCKSPAMKFFDRKIFTLDKTGKTLLKLFTDEAKNALGEIPGDYADKNALNFDNAPFGSMQLLESYLTEFLLVLCRGNNASGKLIRTENSRELADNSIAELIGAYLEDNVYKSLTLTNICNEFYMGKTRLCKIFREYTGTGPIEYYLNLKIAEAKKLLSTDVSVNRIADMLGYSSIHNFSRAFKKVTGMPPSKYKKKINRQ